MIGDPGFTDFLQAGMKAISAFADAEYERLAGRIEYRLRRMPGGAEHRNFWLAYCDDMQRGPSSLEAAFEQDIEKVANHIIAQIPPREAALLTIAAQWEADELECPDSECISEDRIRDQTVAVLRRRALVEELDRFAG